MAEKDLVSMAQQFTGLPMEALIGAPLNAAADANAAMAVTSAKFILDTCFSKTETAPGPPPVFRYDPIMISMSITRGVITPGSPGAVPPVSIQPITTTFDLPIITIMPINNLGVDSVDVIFEMEVKSSYGEQQSQASEQKISASTSWEVKVGWGPVSATITGNASYDQKDTSSFNSHYEKSNSAKYTVKVHAGQLPLPKGVDTIIQAYTLAIEPIQMPVDTQP